MEVEDVGTKGRTCREATGLVEPGTDEDFRSGDLVETGWFGLVPRTTAGRRVAAMMSEQLRRTRAAHNRGQKPARPAAHAHHHLRFLGRISTARSHERQNL